MKPSIEQMEEQGYESWVPNAAALIRAAVETSRDVAPIPSCRLHIAFDEYGNIELGCLKCRETQWMRTTIGPRLYELNLICECGWRIVGWFI